MNLGENIRSKVESIKKNAVDVIKNSAVNIEENVKQTVGSVKENVKKATVVVKDKAVYAAALTSELKKNIKLATQALRIILSNKEIRDEIKSVVKNATEISKKSIEDARDDIIKDKVFLKNLTDTTNKIGDQVSTAMYSTIDGISLGVVSDLRAAYASYMATLNSVDLLSSIVKMPVSKLDEKIKGDSKEIVSLIKSVISIKNNYEATMKRLNDDINNGVKHATTLPALSVPPLSVSVPRVSVPRVSVPLVVGGGRGTYKKNKKTAKVNRNRKSKSKRRGFKKIK
jgi:hypothetical protein